MKGYHVQEYLQEIHATYPAAEEQPVIGSRILSVITESPYLSIGAHYHHERYDGKGYPEGLKGEEIPLFARIISVADTFDAMTANRVYRKGMPFDEVLRELRAGRGTLFDPELLDIFLDRLKLVL